MSFEPQQISECMVRLGFTPKRTPPDFEQSFIGTVLSASGPVTVRIEGICEELIPYPTAYIVDLPPALQNKFLPHLNTDKSLCYLDDETTSLWVVNPESVLATFVEAIRMRINEWSEDKVGSHDFRQELTSYWKGEYQVFDVSQERTIGVHAFYKRHSLCGENETEVVLANSVDDADAWIAKRKGNKRSATGLFIPIDFRQPPYVPHNMEWPPKDFGAFVNWVSVVDPAAKSSLIHKLIKHIDKKGAAFFSFRYGSEDIGFFIDITKETIPIIQRLKPKKKRVKSASTKHINTNLVASSLAKLTKSFRRSIVMDVSETFILQRNKNNASLSGLEGKRIALIGCGTIGGYTAHSLVQIGAGSGISGELHLFDEDTLGPGNLARHLLGIEYLQEQKSSALKHFLDEQGIVNHVVSHGKFCKSDIGARWDFIIDATGHSEFSLSLSRWMHEANWRTRRPSVIHGWVDAYGLASRVLHNSEGTACFGCLTIENGSTRKPRFELFKAGHEPEHAKQFRRGCGKTYMPFSSQPSLAVAGMIQQLCSQSGPTFMQTRFSDQVRSVNNQTLAPLRNCRICSK